MFMADSSGNGLFHGKGNCRSAARRADPNPTVLAVLANGDSKFGLGHNRTAAAIAPDFSGLEWLPPLSTAGNLIICGRLSPSHKVRFSVALATSARFRGTKDSCKITSYVEGGYDRCKRRKAIRQCTSATYNSGQNAPRRNDKRRVFGVN